MQSIILNFAPGDLQIPKFNTILTFRYFLDHIKKMKSKATGHKSHFFSYVIDQFEKRTELLENIDPRNLQHHSDIFELVYNSLTRMMDDEDVNYWALSFPLQPTVFYSTNAFFELLTKISVNNFAKELHVLGNVQVEGNPLEFIYSSILEKCYGITFFNRQILHSVESKDTSLTHYYEITLDTRFVQIRPLTELPHFKIEMIQADMYDKNEALRRMNKLLPLDMFCFEGFGIMTIKDVSVKYAIENIKNYILNHSAYTEGESFINVLNWLKIVVEDKRMEFGLMPLLHVNGELIFDDVLYMNSILITAGRNSGMSEDKCLSLIDHYFRKPELIFFSEANTFGEDKYGYIKIFRKTGIKSYALIPIYFGNSLAGVLEMYSKENVLLNEFVLSKLDAVIPLLSQLLRNSIHEFHDSIDLAIKEKFTSIQPAVQWKFNEVAWHYIRDRQMTNEPLEIEDLGFDRVYPLYGSIDIRNSTVERNEALHKDLQVQLGMVAAILKQLKEETAFQLIEEKIFECNEWVKKINDTNTSLQETGIKDFLENDIEPFLLHFKNENPQLHPILDNYFREKDEKTGIINENRQRLEISMNTLIAHVNNELEKLKTNIQKPYPCYFEKFKTDGVEYDIYIGQSISPRKPFSDVYLKNLRLLQLTSMAQISKSAKLLSQTLPVYIDTTQLIYVHSQPIDIKFRKDEKRFDVEGAYNIRYHIIKKRIDKVIIKNTGERLTQPGKIALVYYNQQELNEYMGYIKFLQEQSILALNLEQLELEPLQGVSGLKAIRVEVVMEEETDLN